MSGFWGDADVPQEGWVCVDVYDLGEVAATCEMCQTQAIRFVHVVEHEDYPGPLEVGCVCSEHMTNDYLGPKRKEAQLRNRAAGRVRWLSHSWRRSASGNEYRNIDGKNVGIFADPSGDGWKWRIEGRFDRAIHGSPGAAKLALFNALYPAPAQHPGTRGRRAQRSWPETITQNHRDSTMPIVATSNGKTFAKAPEGVHRAVCIAVYDLGTQKGFDPGTLARKVLIMWELPDELMDDGRPFAVSERYTLSLNEKANLRKKLNAWRGRPFTEAELKGFDLSQLLGKPCQLQITHEASKADPTTVYANITSIMPLMKGMQAPTPTNPLRQFSIDDPTFPEGTPDWIAKIINGSVERTPGHPMTTVPADAKPQPTPELDEVPF